MDQHSAKSIAQSQKQRCIQTEIVACRQLVRTPRSSRLCFWFCPWLQRHRHQCMSSVRSKNPENKAKHCQMSFAAYAERCWESWFHWHRFEIVLRTYAIFGVTNRLDTNNGSSRFFDGFSMHIHGLPWFTYMKSDALVQQNKHRRTFSRNVVDRSADPTPHAWMRAWLETCIRSGSMWNQVPKQPK